MNARSDLSAKSEISYLELCQLISLSNIDLTVLM